MKRNWETKPTMGPTGFLNTLATRFLSLACLCHICLCFCTSIGSLEHLDNDAHVQLGAHVDRVEQHHDHHDQGAELVPERVVHDDEDGGRHLVGKFCEDVHIKG